MPWNPMIPDWLILARTLARRHVTVGIRTKRPRRAVSYADELLARAATKVAAKLATR